MLKRLGRGLVQLASRVFLSVWDDPQSLAHLARVYALLRESHHRQILAAARARYAIHPEATFYTGTRLYGEGRITIGERTYLGEDCDVVADPRDATVQIGKLCAIARNVHIRTEGYRTDLPFDEARFAPGTWADIVIGDYVWIGANSFICGGVHIGDNSVIGANSVVTRNVPPNAIVAGVPARVIKFKPGSAEANRV